MSGKRNETVRLDLERKLTSRYERREMAAAMAAWQKVSYSFMDLMGARLALPWTTACSP